MRVANLNMTDPDQQCPRNLNLSYTNPIRLCGRKTDRGCDSVTFTTYGVQYQQVCGRVSGYQFGSPDAFRAYACLANCTIDKPYVDGISITHGPSPRKHIWTYAAGVYESIIFDTCPCTGGRTSPSFVGSDYYCEAALDCPPWEPPVLYSMDKIAMDLRAHAVIPQTSRGSARSFLSQLLTIWRFVSVGMSLAPTRILPLTLFNSTYSEL